MTALLFSLLTIAGGAEPIPAEVLALAAKARVAGPIVAWCGAQFASGESGGYAVAVSSAGRAGTYVAIDRNARATELGAFTDGADLACYSRGRAERLNRTIQQSETIEGSIRPRWKTTVICGFTDGTTAACWQYSPAQRSFVKVGGWVT